MARDAPHPSSDWPQGRKAQTTTGSPAPMAEGTYFGRYRLVEEIGVGGMASVHLARMDGAGGFQKWVAVKRVHPHLVEDEHFIRMFLDEARIAASISHPNVAQVFDLGSDGNVHWIAMEYLHGEPLRELMRHNMEIGKPMRPELAARIIADAAEGLHAAHELRGKNGEPLNLVHRDVTPHNLFVTYDGVVKVVDFGIAKVAGRLANTRAGTLKGKIAYMAPEQIKGREIDRRADVFALGVVLWELTTNRRLFRRDSDLETLERVQACLVPPPSTALTGDEYPVELETIVMRALARDRDQRFPSAREMSRALQQYLMFAGEFIGPAEIGAYVTSVFAERIAQREEHLRWAAESTETFSAERLLPGARTTVTNTASTASVESQDTHVDPPRVPRPGVKHPASDAAISHPSPPLAVPSSQDPPLPDYDEDSRSSLQTMETAVLPSQRMPRPVDDASKSTLEMNLPRVSAQDQPSGSLTLNRSTGLPRANVARPGLDGNDDEEEYIQTRVASAPGRHQAAVIRAFEGPSQQQQPAALPIPRATSSDDDPTHQMPPGRALVPDVRAPLTSSGMIDQEVERMRTPWRLYAAYLLVFVASALTVFVLAAFVLRARTDADGSDSSALQPEAASPVASPPLSPTDSAVPVQSADAPRLDPSLPASASAPGASAAARSSATVNPGNAAAFAPGYLSVICVPACEHILVDGRDLGPMATRAPTPPGQYRVRLQGPNGVVKVISAVVVSGEHTMQHVSMY